MANTDEAVPRSSMPMFSSVIGVGLSDFLTNIVSDSSSSLASGSGLSSQRFSQPTTGLAYGSRAFADFYTSRHTSLDGGTSSDERLNSTLRDLLPDWSSSWKNSTLQNFTSNFATAIASGLVGNNESSEEELLVSSDYGGGAGSGESDSDQWYSVAENGAILTGFNITSSAGTGIDLTNNLTDWLYTTTVDTVDTLAEDPVEYHWLFLSLISLVVIGVLGNILVILAICLERRLQNATNFFLLSLAVADLLVSLLVMPIAILNEFYGKSQKSRYQRTSICL